MEEFSGQSSTGSDAGASAVSGGDLVLPEAFQTVDAGPLSLGSAYEGWGLSAFMTGFCGALILGFGLTCLPALIAKVVSWLFSLLKGRG